MPLFLCTLVVTAVFVPIMVSLLVPGTQRLFAGWLSLVERYSSQAYLGGEESSVARVDRVTDELGGRDGRDRDP